MRKLTEAEAQLLTEARWLLADMSRAAQEATVTPSGRDWQLGVVYGACEHGEDAIFDALNMMATYGGDPEAARVLHAKREEAGV